MDSGEWGRGRVAELTAAGELMRAERDALLQLVQALRREYEAVQLAKESQHDELRSLKDKMTVKVGLSLQGLSLLLLALDADPRTAGVAVSPSCLAVTSDQTPTVGASFDKAALGLLVGRTASVSAYALFDGFDGAPCCCVAHACRVLPATACWSRAAAASTPSCVH